VPTKLGRKEFPSGYSPTDFTYKGRPAKDQGDFGTDVGLADCVCVNQFGEANNSKMYHGGVVQSGDGKWWVYLEWGRVKPGKSWNGSFSGQDFQFVKCSDETEARKFFAKQLASKNTKRLEEKVVGGVTVWAGKVDKNGKAKDGYLVQSLATREKGLPDAYSIKDDEGTAKAKPTKKAKAKKSTKTYQPQVIKLASDLVGGVQNYTRALSQATGVTPTLSSITQVRDQLIPAALGRIKKVGDDIKAQVNDTDLQDLSKMVYAIVPRYVPRTGLTDEEAILSSNNILALQADLDAFEAALMNEDFEAEIQEDNQVDPNKVLGRNITWIDPNSDQGKWLETTYLGMTNNRHGHLSGKFKVLNMFAVEDVAKRKAFIDRAKAIAKSRKGTKFDRAQLQPKKRDDVSDISDIYSDANVMMGIHGTRAVNVQPILSSNLRLPKQLKGVHISGSAFGAGIYFADDIKKSHGYTGASGSYWVKGGAIARRGFFMFLCDVTLGKTHMPRTTLWGQPNVTRGYDSVYAKRNITSVANNEYVIFDPNQQFIRYIIEATTH